jgi:hypothetical protein
MAAGMTVQILIPVRPSRRASDLVLTPKARKAALDMEQAAV